MQGLVTGRRHGRMVFYRLTDDFPAPLREYCLRRCVRSWRAGRISILG
jgi:hypothetical protein